MEKLFFTTLILLCAIMVQQAKAQTAHNFGQCYLNKNWKPNAEGVNCPACRSKIDKEKVAKQAEQKRRNDIIAAKNKADREAEQKAFEAEQKRKQEEATKPKSGLVVINAQPKNTTTKTELLRKTEVISNNTIFAKRKGYFYSNSSRDDFGFLNEKGEVIIENTEWSDAHTVSYISFTDTTHKDFGVVRIGDKNHYQKDYSYNLVNAKGEYLIDDNMIFSIQHLRGSWFLISSRGDNYYVLNLETKKKITLPYYNKERQWETFRSYPVAFSDKIVINPSKEVIGAGDSRGTMIYICNAVKKMMVKRFPDKVNEDVLSRFSFVLFHSDYYYSESDLRVDKNINKNSRIEMYGIKDSGEMETIRIK